MQVSNTSDSPLSFQRHLFLSQMCRFKALPACWVWQSRDCAHVCTSVPAHGSGEGWWIQQGRCNFFQTQKQLLTTSAWKSHSNATQIKPSKKPGKPHFLQLPPFSEFSTQHHFRGDNGWLLMNQMHTEHQDLRHRWKHSGSPHTFKESLPRGLEKHGRTFQQVKWY